MHTVTGAMPRATAVGDVVTIDPGAEGHLHRPRLGAEARHPGQVGTESIRQGDGDDVQRRPERYMVSPGSRPRSLPTTRVLVELDPEVTAGLGGELLQGADHPQRPVVLEVGLEGGGVEPDLVVPEPVENLPHRADPEQGRVELDHHVEVEAGH